MAGIFSSPQVQATPTPPPPIPPAAPATYASPNVQAGGAAAKRRMQIAGGAMDTFTGPQGAELQAGQTAKTQLLGT